MHILQKAFCVGTVEGLPLLALASFMPFKQKLRLLDRFKWPVLLFFENLFGSLGVG